MKLAWPTWPKVHGEVEKKLIVTKTFNYLHFSLTWIHGPGMNQREKKLDAILLLHIVGILL